MKTDVSIPDVGESVTQGILTAWLKKEGEHVSEGEDLFELETDKASLAIPSPASGILRIQVQEGSEVSIGQIVATLEDMKDVQPQTSEPPPSETELPKKTEAAEPERRTEETTSPALSPAVRRLVQQYNLHPEDLQGSGKNGRILKKDVLKLVEKKETAAVAGQTDEKIPQKPVEEAPQKPRESHVGETSQKPEKSHETAIQNRVKMTSIRMRTAERLVASRKNSAHLTTFNEIDMAQVKQIRTRYRDEFEKTHGVRLGFMSFFVKACCSALAAFPEVNAFVEEDEIVYNNYYHIGIAVSTDSGLLVPVVKNADTLGFAQIEQRIRDFSQKAGNKTLSPDDFTGGTFTITNGGVFGSLLSTPIPNPPQTAILGMHAIQDRPVANEGAIVIKPMMYVALTYDHRIIDGREAVSFLVKIKQLIEEPERLFLDV
jgi:2-oxoglutarate dehydrogenase E2 component (dihydrolipoamide succinyltransferase)